MDDLLTKSKILPTAATTNANAAAVKWSLRIALVCGVFAFLGGLEGLLAWPLNLERMADWDGNGIAVQPNNAICMMLVGIGVILTASGRQRIGTLFGIAAGVIGIATLFEHLSGIGLGIDPILRFGREWGTRGTIVPGRMGFPASLSWWLFGCAFLLLRGGGRSRRFVPAVAFTVLMIAAVSFVGYLMGADTLYTLPRFTAIAWQSSAVILALAIGLLATLHDLRPVCYIVEDSVTGILMRRLLIPVIIIPLALGAIRVAGQKAGYFDTAMGTALLQIFLVGIFLLIIFIVAANASVLEKDAKAAAALAERNIRESNERFDIVRDTAQVGFWFCDLPFDVLAWDTRVKEHFWLEPDATVTIDTFYERLHPDDRDRTRNAIEYSIDNKTQYEIEYRTIAKEGGAEKWIRAVGRTFYDKQDVPIRFDGVTIDISARKRNERNLAFLADISQDLVKLITIAETADVLTEKIAAHFNTTLCCFAEINEKADVINVTHAWNRPNVSSLSGGYRLSDYTTSELLQELRSGRTVVIPDVEADERLNAESYAALGVASYVLVPILKYGEWSFLLAIQDAVPRDWRIDEVELMEDLTARIWTRFERARAEEDAEQSRRTFYEMVENAPFGVYVVDSEFCLAVVNKGTQERAFANVNPAVGRRFDEAISVIWPEDVANEIIGIFRHTLETGESYYSKDFVQPRADIEKVEGYEWEVHGMKMPDGSDAVICYYFDSSDLRDVQRELADLNRDLEDRVQARTEALSAANAALSEEMHGRIDAEKERIAVLGRMMTAQEEERRRIAAELHDQLGQHMTALRLRLNALKDQAGEDKLAVPIGQIIEIAEDLDADIDGITLSLRPRSLDTLGLVEALAQYVRIWQDQAGILAEFHPNGYRENMLDRDAETALFRITQEALHNCAKHSAAGFVSVLLGYRDDRVTLVIEDDGKGFDPEATIDSDGLGLTSMRERCELIGGELAVESQPEGGTTILVTLRVMSNHQTVISKK